MTRKYEYEVAYKDYNEWTPWRRIEFSTLERRLRSNYDEHWATALAELHDGQELRTAFARYRARET